MCQLCDCDVEPPRSNQLGEGGSGGRGTGIGLLPSLITLEWGIKPEEKGKTHPSGSLENSLSGSFH